jgi:hypothetical protein
MGEALELKMHKRQPGMNRYNKLPRQNAEAVDKKITCLSAAPAKRQFLLSDPQS